MDGPPPVEPTAPEPPALEPPAVSHGFLRGSRWVVAAGLGVVAVIALAAATIALALVLRSGPAIDQMVPATADAYVAFYVDPPLTQKLNLLGLAHRFPDLKTDADLTRAVNRWLDEGFKESGISFSGDVRPWLGSEVVVLAQAGEKPPVALLAVSKDDPRAKAALAKLRAGVVGQRLSWGDETYQGVAVSVGTPAGDAAAQSLGYALLNHTVILASSESLLKEIIDTGRGKRPRLVDSPDFRAALGRFPAAKLVFAYVNGKAVGNEVKRQLSHSAQTPLGTDLTQLEQIGAVQTIGFALVAAPNGLAADAEAKVDASRLDPTGRQALNASGNAAVMTAWIPKRAYGFAATATLNSTLIPLVDTLERSSPETAQQLQEYGITGPTGVLAHLTGEAAVEAEPGLARYPGGALLIGTSDRAGMERFLQRLTETIVPLSLGGTQGITVQRTTYHGALITTLVARDLGTEGYAPSYAVTQGFAIIGSSLGEVEAIVNAHEGGVTIGTADHFKAVIAHTAGNPTALFYADVSAIAEAARSLLPPGQRQTYDKNVAPQVGQITAVLMTTRGSPGSLSELFFVLIGGTGAPTGGTSP